MTLERDPVTADVFGLAGRLPRPGWVVLDAARSHRFTGELLLDTIPAATVYLDRGRIYLAERVTDPSLGTRLIDAGALNSAQLEQGSMHVGDVVHLGRLFERVPAVDRDTVVLVTELMTDECVGWLAGQLVRSVESTPYRHHPAGIQRWDRPTTPDLAPGDPLPSPEPGEAVVEIDLPEPALSAFDSFDDDMIEWDQPSWMDARRPERIIPAAPFVEGVAEPVRDTGVSVPALPEVGADSRIDGTPEPEVPLQTEPSFGSPEPSPVADLPPLPHRGAPSADDQTAMTDWVDQLDSEGLPDPGAEMLLSTKRLPPLNAASLDRFEIIWPSGEVDEQFGAVESVSVGDRHPDFDRAGPTARIMANSGGSRASGAATLDPAVDELDSESIEVSSGTIDIDEYEGVTDDVVLAVRRAVASIETGSLAARRRLVDTAPTGDPSRGVASQPDRPATALPPGRTAMMHERVPGADPSQHASTRSVFDDVGVAQTELAAPQPPLSGQPAVEPARAGALRRLIGSLRRH